jgi:4-hydroxybenzoyl-CoA reductase subunit beta
MTSSIPELRLVHPRDTAEAIAMRGACADSRFIAGGTDLVVNLRHGLGRPSLLVDLSTVEELSGLVLSDEGLRIGAGMTVAALARVPQVAKHYPALAQAAEAIAAPGHRSLATVGGNLCLDTRCIYYNQSEWWRRANGFCLKHGGEVCHVAPQGRHCHAAFTGDLAPALLALEAQVEIAGAERRRRIPLDALYVEDGIAPLTLGENELVVAVHVPPARTRSAYGKARVRGAIDYPLAGVAVALRAEAGALTALRIALTGTNSRPFVLAGTDALVGRPLDEPALQQIDRLVRQHVQPMRTTVASAHYRRLAAAGLARRLATQLFASAAAA